MNKRITSTLLCIILLLCLVAPAIASPTVLFNGTQLTFDVEPVNENYRILVPLRTIFEALGAQVQWHGETNSITAVKGDVSITLQIGSKVAIKNGNVIYLDVPARAINNRTLVPLRFVSEAFGAQVNWDGIRTITINTNTTSVTSSMLNNMLLVAAKNGDVNEVNRLLSMGAYVDASDPRTKESALILAIEYGQVEVVKTLLLKGADPNWRDMGNNQPLMFAAIEFHDNDNKEVVEYLIAAGADPNNQNMLGNTALMGACSMGYRNKAWAILSSNCNIYLRNNAGKTALDIAAENGYWNIVTMIHNFER